MQTAKTCYLMSINFLLTVQWNPDFSNLQRKRKLVRKIGQFEKSGVKLQHLTEEKEMTFGSNYGEF